MAKRTESKAGMGFAVATIFVDAIGIGLIFPIMPDLLADLGIEYIEEPLTNSRLLIGAEAKPAELALDETLAEIKPDELGSFSGVKTIVL